MSFITISRSILTVIKIRVSSISYSSSVFTNNNKKKYLIKFKLHCYYQNELNFYLKKSRICPVSDQSVLFMPRSDPVVTMNMSSDAPGSGNKANDLNIAMWPSREH